jgi:hypothetical protein
MFTTTYIRSATQYGSKDWLRIMSIAYRLDNIESEIGRVMIRRSLDSSQENHLALNAKIDKRIAIMQEKIDGIN